MDQSNFFNQATNVPNSDQPEQQMAIFTSSTIYTASNAAHIPPNPTRFPTSSTRFPTSATQTSSTQDEFDQLLNELEEGAEESKHLNEQAAILEARKHHLLTIRNRGQFMVEQLDNPEVMHRVDPWKGKKF